MVVTVLQGGFGVVVTVVVIFTQHVALVHLPLAQTVSSGLLLKPDGHAKDPHVGAGVVVTVLQGGFGVVVTVVVIFTQHVASVHLPLAQTVSLSLPSKPDGHVKDPHVGAGVVVTVLQGGFGVVVTVVTISLQHVAFVHLPLAQTVSSGLLSKPAGQLKLAQVGAGVVVTVLHGGFGVVVFVAFGVVVLVAAGVVVTVVGAAEQHTSAEHFPPPQTVPGDLTTLPAGHVKFPQDGGATVQGLIGSLAEAAPRASATTKDRILL